jgi:hypothetical protein
MALSFFYKIRIQHFEVSKNSKKNLGVGNDVLYYYAKSQDDYTFYSNVACARVSAGGANTKPTRCIICLAFQHCNLTSLFCIKNIRIFFATFREHQIGRKYMGKQ